MEPDKLAADYALRVSANPMDFAIVPLLTDALVASGHPERIQSALAGWEMRLDQSVRPFLSAMMRAIALQEGKLERCKRLCEATGQLRGNVYRLHAMLAFGQATEVARDPAFEQVRADPWVALAVGLGFLLEGQKKEAAEWHKQGMRPAQRADQRLSPCGRPTPGHRPSGRGLRGSASKRTIGL